MKNQSNKKSKEPEMSVGELIDTEKFQEEQYRQSIESKKKKDK